MESFRQGQCSVMAIWLFYGSLSCTQQGLVVAFNSVLDSSPLLSKASATRSERLVTVPMQKQYSPVVKDGKTIAFKTSYFGTIHVGTPDSEPFRVVFDSGSGHFILPSVHCGSETCMNHNRYNRTNSSSAVDIEHDGKSITAEAAERDQVAIAFGTGEVLGEFVREDVCLEPLAASCVSLRAVLATEMTDDPFSLFNFDGVLGLGLTPLTIDPHFSFFGQMMEQYSSMSPQFSFYLAKHEGGRSEIAFGGHDPRRATSEIEWVDVVHDELGYWTVPIKGIRIGDAAVDDCDTGGCYAIVDTGTSLLGVPRQMTRQMHRLLARPVPDDHQAMAISQIDCREIPGKTMDFDLGSTVVSLTVEDYSRPAPFNMTVATEDAPWRLFCRSLLLPVDPMEEPLGPKVFLWGEPVLRRYYTVFDFKNKRVGFSVARESSELEMGALPSVNAPEPFSTLSGTPIPPKKAYADSARNLPPKAASQTRAQEDVNGLDERDQRIKELEAQLKSAREAELTMKAKLEAATTQTV